MPYKERPIEKLYYSIGEVADMFGVSTSLIRFWESEFDILQPKKNRKGDRSFTKKDIDTLNLIFHLVKEKGFTLKGAKQHIKNNRAKTERNIKVIQALKKMRGYLSELKSNL